MKNDHIPISTERRGGRSRRPSFWLLILLLFLPALGALLAAPLGKDIERAITAIAEYTVDETTTIDELADHYGFKPAVSRKEWAYLPAIHKLEMVYRAAEKAEPGRGGTQVLALMSRDLALMYDGVRTEPVLQTYFSETNAPGDAPPRFASPGPRRGPVSADARAAIRVLADYAAGGTNSAYQMLTDPTTFNMPPDEAYELLATSKSDEQALAKALENHSPEDQNKILRALTLDVRARYDGAKFEKALDPFDRPPHGPSGPTGGGTSGPPGPGGPDGPPPTSGPRRPPHRPTPPPPPSASSTGGPSYHQFLDANFPAGKRGFSNMSRGSRGWGGVVFGNDVTSQLPRIMDVRQQMDDSLVLLLADGTVLTYPAMPDLVQAAYRIVYTGHDGLAPLKHDEAVGLVGLLKNSVSYRCNLKSMQMDVVGRFDVVLHPALADTHLGWSALMADILPVLPDSMIASARAAGHDADATQVEHLFRLNWGDTWKLLDVPLQLKREGLRLTVHRAPAAGEKFPAGMRRTAFIEMLPIISVLFGNDHHDTAFAHRFYRAFSALARISYDYHQINEFAAVLAIVRQANKDGATFTPPIRAVDVVPTPLVVTIDSSGVRPDKVMTPAERLRADLEELEQCVRALDKRADSPEARALKERVEAMMEIDTRQLRRMSEEP